MVSITAGSSVMCWRHKIVILSSASRSKIFEHRIELVRARWWRRRAADRSSTGSRRRESERSGRLVNIANCKPHYTVMAFFPHAWSTLWFLWAFKTDKIYWILKPCMHRSPIIGLCWLCTLFIYSHVVLAGCSAGGEDPHTRRPLYQGPHLPSEKLQHMFCR